MVDKPTVISIFAGTGGSSLGYHWAGFKELLAIDFDDHAVKCFKLNFPDVPIWHKSIIEVTGKQILEFCKIKRGELDVFDGSPPCQGFSTAGKREVNDPRNDLFKHYWRLINEIQPKAFVMENVTGMVKGTMKGRFIEIIKTLKEGNYNVKCKQMNTKYYGVPQSRERLIFIGIRKDLKIIPKFPIANKEIITVNEVWKDIKNSTLELIEASFVSKSIYKYWKEIKEGEAHIKRFSLTRINRTKPSPTLTKTGGLVHYSEPRYLTKIELKRICSFPDNWKIPGTLGQAYSRFGNAVMPKFMQAIAEYLKEQLEEARLESPAEG